MDKKIHWQSLHPNIQRLFQKQERPIVVLAPMEDVTIVPFRKICKRYGADLVYTEFIPAAGLVREVAACIKKLEYQDEERPLSVQIYGSNPMEMARAARMVEKIVQPDFIDINLGCPVKKIANRGDGAGLLKPDGYVENRLCSELNLPPKNLKNVLCAVVDAVSTPVTVKMRLGWDHKTIYVVESMQWFKEWGIQMIAIHARTKQQAYTGKADWSYIKQAKQASSLPIIGNGDLTSAEIVLQRIQETQVDGVMIGRAAITAPWIFRDVINVLENKPPLPLPDLSFRVEQYLEMISEAIPVKGEYKAVIEMRKYLHAFVGNEYGAARVRKEVMQYDRYSDVKKCLENYVLAKR
ncbi:MAG: tRNA-dihydrouridine synthase family protein [bacterium]|nr:tRNA-dihydrouridine synthase family protein [bacterium]